jgi:hypothetical protein
LSWFNENVGAHPVITPLEIDLGIIAMKATYASIADVPKTEYPNEYAHQDEYSMYGWVKWSDDIDQQHLHLVARLTINEPEYQ